MNCLTCNYIKRQNKENKCTRKIFEDGIIAVIPTQKLELDCPCHSSNHLVEETRYDLDNEFRNNSKDVCPICGRMVKDKNNFRKYKVDNDETGEVVERNICKICFDNLGKQKDSEVDAGNLY